SAIDVARRQGIRRLNNHKIERTQRRQPFDLLAPAPANSSAVAHEKRDVAADFGGQACQPLLAPMNFPSTICQSQCSRRIAGTAPQTRAHWNALYQLD